MSRPFDVEQELHQHGSALRALARELVLGADVDDVVQETWQRVLRSPPRDGEGFGGWLATVLRNVTRRWRRGEARRRRHEEVAAAVVASGRVDDPAAPAARAELAHRLLAVVDALDAPYRDVIWQRYFEGMPPRAIAAASGVPLATVKSRLQRGLGMLRERLGEGSAARGDWRGALAVAFGLREGTSVAAAAALTGGVLVATWIKGMMVVAAAAIAAAVWWPRAPEVSPAVHAPPSAVLAVADAQRADLDPGAGRQELAPLPGQRLEAPPGAAAPEATMATVRGRCIDAQGKPLADCVAVLSGWKASDERMDEFLRDHERPQWTDPPAVTTGDDGIFTIRFVPPPPFQFDVRLHSPKHGAYRASWQQMTAGVADLGDIAMQTGGRLAGRVVDGVGRPVPNNMLVVERLDQRQLGRAHDGELRPGQGSAHSDAGGAFAFAEPLLPGSYAVVSKGKPQLEPLVVEIRAGEDQSAVVVVDVPEEVSIRGRVIDEVGQPVVGASVEGRPRPEGRFWRTAADGSFVMRMPRRDGVEPIDVVAECRGYEGKAVVKAVPWGRDEVVLTLRRGARLELRVAEVSGRPVDGYTVRLLGREPMRPTDSRLRAGGPFAAGVATIAGVEKGQWLAVVEFPAASRLATANVPFVVDAAGVVQVHVTARAVCERRARVVDEAGEPVAGAELVVCEALDGVLDETTLLATAETHSQVSGPKKAMIVAKAITDSAGFATLQGPAAQPLAVALPGGVHVPVFVRDVRLDDPATLVVTVPRGVRLLARVQPARALAALQQLGGVPAGSTFAAAASRPLLMLQGASGRTVPDLLTALRGTGSGPGRLRDDGTFELRGLRAERYQMFLFYWGPNRGSEQVPVGILDLTSGEDRELALDLSALIPGTLVGSLVVNGAAAMLRKVRFEGAAKRQAETDGAGRFEVLLPAGSYRVLALLTADAREVWAPLADGVIVRQDEVTTLPLSVQSGRLRLTLRRADGTPGAHVDLVGTFGGTESVVRLPPTGPDGTLEVELPVGSIAIAIDGGRMSALLGKGRAAAALGTATITTGQTTTVELRLPSDQGK